MKKPTKKVARIQSSQMLSASQGSSALLESAAQVWRRLRDRLRPVSDGLRAQPSSAGGRADRLVGPVGDWGHYPKVWGETEHCYAQWCQARLSP